MSINKYVKKPVVIEAIQFLGADNLNEVKEFLGPRNFYLKPDFQMNLLSCS